MINISPRISTKNTHLHTHGPSGRRRHAFLMLGLCTGLTLPAIAADPIFGTASTRLGVQPESMVTGDLNGDGNLDAVVTGQVAQGLGEIAGSIYFGRGDGTFDLRVVLL